MSTLVENTFKKIGDNRYVTVNRQIAFAIPAGIGFLILFPFFIQIIIDEFRSHFMFGLVGLVMLGPCTFLLLLFVAMGLLTVTTEIDLSSRVVRVTRMNYRRQRAVQEQSLDSLQLSAADMGVTDASPKGGWIVRAGFAFEDENGEEGSVAIWSKEVTTVEERNSVLFELYPFFFPDRPVVDEQNLITNGKVVLLLSNEERTVFLETGELPGAAQRKAKIIDPSKKWDRLL